MMDHDSSHIPAFESSVTVRQFLGALGDLAVCFKSMFICVQLCLQLDAVRFWTIFQNCRNRLYWKLMRLLPPKIGP